MSLSHTDQNINFPVCDSATGLLAPVTGRPAVEWDSPLMLEEQEAGYSDGRVNDEEGGGHAEANGFKSEVGNLKLKTVMKE